jgi:hypothetical protein
MEVTRERNLYKVKYQELKGRLHQFEQRFAAPLEVTTQQY